MFIKEGYVHVPGGRIWYQQNSYEESKNKTPLLIVHGGPGIPHDYLNSLISLAKQRPVIFYDQLGCGRSQISKNDNALWTLDRFEEELETLVTQLHLKKFYLLGHSWGGGLVTQYVSKHPDNVKALILASPLLSTQKWISDAKILLGQLDPDIQRIIETSEAQSKTGSSEYQEAMDKYYHRFVCRLNPWPRELTDAFDRLNLNIYHTMWGPSEFMMDGNLKYFDVVDKLSHLKIPILVTAGQHDEARPETLSSILENMANGRLIIYPKSSHVAFLEEQKDYLKNLEMFLKEIDELSFPGLANNLVFNDR